MAHGNILRHAVGIIMWSINGSKMGSCLDTLLKYIKLKHKRK
jgi:hypothetical protein